MKYIALHHRVTIISFGTERERQLLMSHFGPIFDDVIFVPAVARNLIKGFARAWYLITLRSDFRRLYRPNFQRVLSEAISRIRPDLVYLSTTMLGCYRIPADVAILGDTHNVEHDNLARGAQKARGVWRRLYFRIQSKLTECEELRYDRSCDGICAVSDRDASLVRVVAPGRPIFVVPNGVELRRFSLRGNRSEPATLVFVGLMNYYPNSHGVEWFLDEVYPKVLLSVPAARVVIVGARPSLSLRRRKSDRVDVTGYVPDVRPFLANATVAIIPLHIGGGTRIKALEAMAMGVPLVSTTVGCEGLGASDGQSVLLADTPEDFSDRVVRLILDEKLRNRLAHNAGELVAKYECSKIAHALNDACVATLQARRSQTTWATSPLPARPSRSRQYLPQLLGRARQRTLNRSGGG